MGKGDIKTTKGKRARGSYGKTRKRKESPKPIIVTKKKVSKKQVEVQSSENSEATKTTKKAAPKTTQKAASKTSAKTTTAKKTTTKKATPKKE